MLCVLIKCAKAHHKYHLITFGKGNLDVEEVQEALGHAFALEVAVSLLSSANKLSLQI